MEAVHQVLPPIPEDASTPVGVTGEMAPSATKTYEDELNRRTCRNELLRQIIYKMPADSDHGIQNQLGQIHYYAINFVADIDFTMGATHWRDMPMGSLLMLSTFLELGNMLESSRKNFPHGVVRPVQNATGQKTLDPLTLADADAPFSVKYTTELLPSTIDANTGERTCQGYRLIMRVHALERPPRVEPPPDNGGGASAARRQASAAEKMDRLNTIARAAPLAFALERLLRQNNMLTELYEKRCSEFVKMHKKMPGGIAAARQRALQEVPLPEALLPYLFSRVKTHEDFIYKVIQPFYRRPRMSDVRDDDPAPGFLQLNEDQDTLASVHQHTTAQYPHANHNSPMNPDMILSFSRSMAYRVRELDDGSTITKECCRMDSYYPDLRRITEARRRAANANNVNNNHPVMPPPGRRHQAHTPVIQEESEDHINESMAHSQPGEDDDQEQRELDESDLQMNTTNNNNNNATPDNARADNDVNETNDQDAMDIDDENEEPLPSLGEYILSRGAMRHDDPPSRLSAPFPALIYSINVQVTYSEIMLPLMPLPIPIGAVLSDDAMDGAPDRCYLDEDNVERNVILTEGLDATERMCRLEAKRAAEPNQTGNTMRTQRRRRGRPAANEEEGIPRRYDIVQAEQVGSVGDALNRVPLAVPESEADRLEMLRRMGANGVPTELVPTKERQIEVIRKKLDELMNRYRKGNYPEVNEPTNRIIELPASDTYIPVVDFEPLKNPDLFSTASQLQQHQRYMEEFAQRIAEGPNGVVLTAKQKRDALNSVDLLPEWKRERCELLQMRPMEQMAFAVLKMAHSTLEEAISQEVCPMDESPIRFRMKQMLRLSDLRMQNAKEVDDIREQQWKKYHNTFLTTKNNAPAFLAAAAYMREFVLPNKSHATIIQNGIRARPFVMMGQTKLDAYRTGALVVKQNALYMEISHTIGYHGFRWILNRGEPAMNLLFSGASGTGKSFCLLINGQFMLPGVVQNTTAVTTNAFTVEQDFDGYLFIFEEAESDMLFSNTNKNETGSTNKINFTKARMSSHMTSVTYFDRDEENNKRASRTIYASCHTITMAATNQFLQHMDKAMRRRFLIIPISEIGGETEGAEAHTAKHRNLTSTERRQVDAISARMRDWSAAYIYLEQAQKAGVMNELPQLGAEFFLENILSHVRREQGISLKPTKRHWLMEGARILSLQYATYMMLYSWLAAFVYFKHPDKVEKWGHTGFLRLGVPFAYISTDAVISSCTLFDPLICTREENLLFIIIVLELCGMGTGLRSFRKVPDGQNNPVDDYNYFAFSAPKTADIYARIIQRTKRYGEYRAEDLKVMFSPYTKAFRSSCSYTGEVDPQTNMVTLSIDAESPMIERRVLMIDEDHTMRRKDLTVQFCILVDFFANLFDVDVCNATPEEITAKLLPQLVVLDPDLFRNKDPTEALKALRDFAICSDDRAPVVKSLRTVGSHPSMNRSPYEHPTLLPNLDAMNLHYTNYLPDNAALAFPNPDYSAEKSDVPRTISSTVTLDGTPLLLRLERKANGPDLRLPNLSKPHPTAMMSIFGKMPTEDEVNLLDTDTDNNNKTSGSSVESLGLLCNSYDPNYIMSTQVMADYGHSGFDCLHEVFLLACEEQRDMRRYPRGTEAQYRRDLFEAIPELDPASGVPLPFAFPPITYRIEDYLRRHPELFHENTTEGEESPMLATVPKEPTPILRHYPLDNFYRRLQATVKRYDAEHNNNENGAYVSVDEKIVSDLNGTPDMIRARIMRTRGQFDQFLDQMQTNASREQERQRTDKRRREEEEEIPDARAQKRRRSDYDDVVARPAKLPPMQPEAPPVDNELEELEADEQSLLEMDDLQGEDNMEHDHEDDGEDHEEEDEEEEEGEEVEEEEDDDEDNGEGEEEGDGMDIDQEDDE